MDNFERKGKTIQEIREAKILLEKEVDRLIRNFEEGYDVKVKGSYSGVFALSGDEKYKVYIDLNL